MEIKKPSPPPKKVPAKKSSPGKPAAATPPVKKPAPPAVKPVAPPAKQVAAAAKKDATPERVARLPKTTGNYAWLLRRLQAQAVNQLTTSNNRAAVRDGLVKCDTYGATRSFLFAAKVANDEGFERFLNVFFAATINR